MNYIITVTPKQLELLTLACNQAMRIHIGQLSDPLTVLLNFEIGYQRHHNGEPAPIEVPEKLDELSRLCWNNKSYGYGYDEKSKEYWVLYQIFKNVDAPMPDCSFQVTFHQLGLLRTVCEQAARLRAGQLDCCFIEELVGAYHKETKGSADSPTNIRKYITEACNYLHTLCWNLPANADHGMNYDDDSDIWWDMYQVFRYQIWKEKHPYPSNQDILTVDGDTPMHTGNEPLIKIQQIFID